MTLLPGLVLNNRYRVVRLLGQGGFGAVYKAWDMNLERPCALKENIEVSPAGQAQFFREAKILSTLRHPGLPLVSDHFIVAGQGQYLVMDYIEGEDLNEKVAVAGGRLPEALVLPWALQVLEALAYMHSRTPPVIHRDIKPANIKITQPDQEHPQGQAVLVDFGIAKVYDPQMKTTLGARAFTPGYSPHEQYGRGTTDARTDVYALGATLYMLLTGQEPEESIQRVVDDPLLPPCQLEPGISLQTEAAILKAMQVNPAQRFQSAGEFKAGISGQLSIAGGQPISIPVSPSVTPLPATPASSGMPPVQATVNLQLEGAAGYIAPAPVSRPSAPVPRPVILTPERLILAPGITLDMVRIPAGEFWMGCDQLKDNAGWKDELPFHRLGLPEYWIGRYPVTVAQFRAFTQATQRKPPSSRLNSGGDSHPVTNVSWDDALAFCAWASQMTGQSIHLPSEPEWEKAGRGTDGRLYPWGNQLPDKKRCNYGRSVGTTTPVGSYSPLGDSPYGCADMAGNVWEWTGSLSWPYPYRIDDGREDAGSRAARVLRGGSFINVESSTRCANRAKDLPGYKSDYLGFRVTLTSA